MELVIIYGVLAVAGGLVASGKNRSGLGWFLLCLLLTPLAADHRAGPAAFGNGGGKTGPAGGKPAQNEVPRLCGDDQRASQKMPLLWSCVCLNLTFL